LTFIETLSAKDLTFRNDRVTEPPCIAGNYPSHDPADTVSRGPV
jgi:hypothetical protein